MVMAINCRSVRRPLHAGPAPNFAVRPKLWATLWTWTPHPAT